MDCKPELRFSEFTKNWNLRKIGEFAKIEGGGTPDTKNPKYWNGNLNWFTPTEVGKNKYVSSSDKKIIEEGLNHISAKLLPKNTILLSSRATMGHSSITIEKTTTNQGFQSLIVDENNNTDFVYYLIKTIQKDLITKASDSTFLEISKNEISNIETFIPH